MRIRKGQKHMDPTDPDPATPVFIIETDLGVGKDGAGEDPGEDGGEAAPVSGCGSGRPKNIWILQIRIRIRNAGHN
jgi:hypothetical protein